MLLARRLAAQQISNQEHAAPAKLVAWLTAVQAQDYAAATWGLALRLEGSPAHSVVERALEKRRVVRTHALRGTWQFVTPKDARWITRLGAGRIVQQSAARYRQLGLTQRDFDRSMRIVARALEQRDSMTRKELEVALERGGVSTAGQRLSHLLLRAELEEVICGGARVGSQISYSLFDRVAPAKESMPTGSDACAVLAARYFRSRGPATAADFAWWSGLTLGQARAASEAAAPRLERDVVAGTVHYFGGSVRQGRSSGVWLLPAFDEWLIAYKNRDATLAPEHAKRVNAGGGMLDPCIVIGGRVMGTWRRTLSRERVAIELHWFTRPSSRDAGRAHAAAERYAASLGRVPEISETELGKGGKLPPLRSRSARKPPA